jgi:iron complex outermembrane receptor protein
MTKQSKLKGATVIGRSALCLALATGGGAVSAQAPETQTSTNPAPAEDRAAQSAGAANNPGPAASSKAGSSDGVEEIVVTAQFREQNLQDTPIAITAVSSAMLEARSQTNISQVANQAPSVTLRPQGTAYGASLGANIRGIGQFDFNPALEPGVGLYVDDVYYATLTGSILDLLDLDRVEILRGPQGTLAGKNSIGGAVKLYSKRPTGSNSGFVQAAYGSRDRIDLRGAFDFKLTDTVSARLSGVAKRQGGYVDRLDFGCVNPPGSVNNPNPPAVNPNPAYPATGTIPATLPAGHCLVAKDGNVNYQAVRGQLRWQPSDRLDINIIGDYTNDDRHPAAEVLLDRFNSGVRVSPIFNGATARPPRDIDPFTPNPTGTLAGTVNPNNIVYDTRFLCGKYCNYASYTQLQDGKSAFYKTDAGTTFKGWGVSGEIEFKLNPDMQLVSISAYRHYVSTFTNDNDNSPLAIGLGYGSLPFNFFSQELRLNGSFADGAINYTLGGFYSDQKARYTTLQILRYAGNEFFGDDPVESNTKAAFVHASWEIVNGLTLTGGLRYTDDRKVYTFHRYQPDGSLPAPANVQALNGPNGNGLVGVFDGPQSTRFDYRANIQYEFTRDISVYGQISTGYKGGGVSPRPFFASQVAAFGPESLTAYELGFKSDLFDRKMRLNVAAFLSKYKGIQLTLNNCKPAVDANGGPPSEYTPCALPANIGDADIKGIEVETSIRPFEGMIIDASGSYIDFEYKKVNSPLGVPLVPITARSTYTPKWKWSVGAQYAVDLGSSGSITPRIDLSYQSSVFTSTANRQSSLLSGYTLGNARLTWANDGKDLEISAEVTNLFDKYYFLTIFDSGAGGNVTGQPGRPREWALTVKKKF